jgi:phosphatidylglycerophosphatase A
VYCGASVRPWWAPRDRKHVDFVARLIGTFGFTGFFPFAPATFASLVFAAIYAWIPGGEWLAHPLVCALTLVASVPVSTHLEKKYGKDPGCVVIDEVVGMQAVLVWASDVSMGGIFLVFVFFRVFDIVKPFPAHRSQRLQGGWGIVVDDAIAGVYTRAAMILCALVWPSLGAFF